MLKIRKASDRGHYNHGWLDTYHTFSFGDYHDPEHHHFRVLRVINDDRVSGGMGFGMHPHRDMEIITVVLSGALEHKDSLGNGAQIRPGEVQRMSAGTGILHSEFNPSPTEPVHLYQIWIVPDRKGHSPSYEQKMFPVGDRTGRWQLIVSPDGRDGSVTIHQNATVQLGQLTETGLEYTFGPERHGWLQIMSGSATVNGLKLETADGLAISDETTIRLTGDADVMLFDLP